MRETFKDLKSKIKDEMVPLNLMLQLALVFLVSLMFAYWLQSEFDVFKDTPSYKLWGCSVVITGILFVLTQISIFLSESNAKKTHNY